MSIINRSMHISEQQEWITYISPQSVGNSTLIQTGATILLAMMPYPGLLLSGRVAATGVSNAMQLSLGVHRFVAGSGLTLITMGLSNLVLSNLSTSGCIGWSGLPVTGSTLLGFTTGDCFVVTTSVANGAATSVCLELVVRKTQDIVQYNLTNQ